MAESLTREQFLRLIPNREPYLWIDEVATISPDAIHCRKHLPADLDLFQGHYVGFPLFPGALQCEAAFQAASILIAHRDDVASSGIPVIARVNNVKFRRMVRPPQTLDIFVEIRDRVGPAFFLQGHVEVEGTVTTTLDFVATEAPADAVPE
jgi:3-hydroxyacyl-[acyl-carrier-protein] dehydratase